MMTETWTRMTPRPIVGTELPIGTTFVDQLEEIGSDGGRNS